MAKIKDAKPKNSSGSYERVFNNKALGDLITKVHSTSISNGNELERIILSDVNPEYIINDYDAFLIEFQKYPKTDNVIRLISKKVLKNSKRLKPQKNSNNKTFEPDFVVLKIDKTQQRCYIIELKDGFTFDTKKIMGEKAHLQEFQNYIGNQIPFSTCIKFCCFNETDKNKIRFGLKGEFELDEIMTGDEFCKLIGLDYKKILNGRKGDSIANIDYFVCQLLLIDDVRQKLFEKLSQEQ